MYVARKGDPQAGAIHILVGSEDGPHLDLYSPALPQTADSEPIGGRAFAKAGWLADYEAQLAFQEREKRLDTDFWLIEIENWRGPLDELFTVTEG